MAKPKKLNKESESTESEPEPLDLKAAVAKRMKEIRKKQGFENQERFAWEHELSRSLYGKYEKGANMTLDSLERVIAAFGISVKEFFSKGFDIIPQEDKLQEDNK